MGDGSNEKEKGGEGRMRKKGGREETWNKMDGGKG
jgi:hypothetical protein